MSSSVDFAHAEVSGAARADLNALIVDATASLIVVLDRDGRIVRFNRACEVSSGYSLAEVEGKVVWDFLLDAAEGAAVRRVFEAIVAGRGPRGHECDWLTRDGRK